MIMCMLPFPVSRGNGSSPSTGSRVNGMQVNSEPTPSCTARPHLYLCLDGFPSVFPNSVSPLDAALRSLPICIHRRTQGRRQEGRGDFSAELTACHCEIGSGPAGQEYAGKPREDRGDLCESFPLQSDDY